MGAAHARGFAAEGGRVVIGDVLDDDGAAVEKEIGGAARYVHLDVTSPDDWQAAVVLAEQEFGSLSVLVNNAGIGGTPSTVVDADHDEWHRVLSVNLDGALYGIQAAVPSLTKSGGGAIVNISSFAGLIGSPLLGAYAASKFALRGLTKVAAMELGPVGIRVNSVHPGFIRTALLDGIADDVVRGRLAIERIAEPADVTPVVLFASSDESRYVTGTELVVDGGWSNGEPSPIFVPPGVEVTDEMLAMFA